MGCLLEREEGGGVAGFRNAWRASVSWASATLRTRSTSSLRLLNTEKELASVQEGGLADKGVVAKHVHEFALQQVHLSHVDTTTLGVVGLLVHKVVGELGSDNQTGENHLVGTLWVEPVAVGLEHATQVPSSHDKSLRRAAEEALQSSDEVRRRNGRRVDQLEGRRVGRHFLGEDELSELGKGEGRAVDDALSGLLLRWLRGSSRRRGGRGTGREGGARSLGLH